MTFGCQKWLDAPSSSTDSQYSSSGEERPVWTSYDDLRLPSSKGGEAIRVFVAMKVASNKMIAFTRSSSEGRRSNYAKMEVGWESGRHWVKIEEYLLLALASREGPRMCGGTKECKYPAKELPK